MSSLADRLAVTTAKYEALRTDGDAEITTWESKLGAVRDPQIAYDAAKEAVVESGGGTQFERSALLQYTQIEALALRPD